MVTGDSGDQRKRGKMGRRMSGRRRSGRRREGREGAELSPISAELRWSGNSGVKVEVRLG